LHFYLRNYTTPYNGISKPGYTIAFWVVEINRRTNTQLYRHVDRQTRAANPTKYIYINKIEILTLWTLDYRSRGPGYKKKVVGLERGPLSLVSTTEELLDRKVAASV
jgi:hypothetical protein